MSKEILDNFIGINFVLPLFAIVLLLITFRRNSTPMKWFTSALIFTWIPIPISLFLLSLRINPNYANSGFYVLALLLYMPFYYHVINRPALKSWFIGLTTAQVVFGTINVLFIQKETINSYSSISFNLIVIVCSLLYYYSLLRGDFRENIVQMPAFWLVTAFFIQCSGQVIIISFTFYLINVHQDNLVLLWVFHHGLSITTEVINLYGAALHFRQVKSRQSSPGS